MNIIVRLYSINIKEARRKEKFSHSKEKTQLLRGVIIARVNDKITQITVSNLVFGGNMEKYVTIHDKSSPYPTILCYTSMVNVAFRLVL